MKKNAKNKIQKWSRRDLILFLERLEMYISGGLILNKALEICAQGISKRQAVAVGNMRKAVEAGSSSARAFSLAINLPLSILGLIESGESSGRLAGALISSRNLLERQDE